MNDVLNQLESWAARGALRSLDIALTRFIAEHAGSPSPELLLATALLSERNGHGHVCLDLASVLADPAALLSEDEAQQALPQHNECPVAEELSNCLQGWQLQQWVAALLASNAVTDARHGQSPSDSSSPLVLAGSEQTPLLYLRRYWVYEQQIQTGIQQRLQNQHEWSKEDTARILTQLFPPKNVTAEEPANDWQKIACALASRTGFGIITGGPGTGKTTTVIRLLALLQGLQQSQKRPPLNIRLAAPTGKAAARLSESLTKGIEQVKLSGDLADCRQDIPTDVTTLHRLLGSRPGSRHFRHHAKQPLPADLVVIDEASMVDVEMLAKLFDALMPHTRLILLGDKDQLASVEAGSVLGDFCRSAAQGNYTSATLQWLQQVTQQSIPEGMLNASGSSLAQATTMLRHSYRFAKYPGIGALADSVNSGTATPADIQAICTQYARTGSAVSPQHNLELIRLQKPEFQSSKAAAEGPFSPLKNLVKQGYQTYLTELIKLRPSTDARESLDPWALAVFKAHSQFQLLTPVRTGPWGVDALNILVLNALKTIPSLRGLLPQGNPAWYPGRPVLVTRNDYSLKLMNGDIGICFEWPESQVLRVAFPDGQGGIRWVLPSRLQGVETVFAMTVHKSQGSEFTHTALVLPSHDTPVLTKELLYTGITRSSEAFTLLYSDTQVLANTLTRRVQRASGLQN
ncbi:exodeoxyribonuclease V subunit alpha [Aliidiomarina taiwanensis]|uniref:RecBCD enzyme subunit RecD n=1 Tax=Aliidiomarina taiwanensis TaxID=946228 RepID=A0A432X988_9GAMM|nr:exodeoxyribonuclease V subunit alpha [Aliidiomarina taiwanensis]RUO43958.1 exodeoxyribonuclease V subunit alpha [Aliidiomarina taiwanensis]